VSLKGKVGDEIKVSVKISPATKGLFDIIEAKADKGKEIRISLTETKKPDGKAYVLAVENTKKTKGRYRDTIKLLTTSSIRKELIIPVYGNIKARQIAAIRPTGHVQLRGYVGEPIKASVTIVPKDEHLFDIIEAKADSGKEIRFTLTKSKETDGKTYVLTVENTRKTKGRYRDTIKLLTNSKIQKTIAVPISGEIRTPEIASIRPKYVILTGSAGEPIKRLVKVIPDDKYPFSITEVKPRDGKNIKCDLKEVEESGKKIYVLTVENLKKEKGRYSDMINLKTDRKDHPEIQISVSGRIRD